MEVKSKYSLMVRLLHGLNLLVLTLLGFSGWYIYNPSKAPFFTSMSFAREVHFYCMYLYFWLGIFHVYYFFASGRYKEDFFTEGALRHILDDIKYYLFIRKQKENPVRYHSLQKLAYALLMVIALIQSIIGFTIYFHAYPSAVAIFNTVSFGMVQWAHGMNYIKAIHVFFTWVFFAFLILHLYLIISEDIGGIKEMFTGKTFTNGKEKA